MKIMSLLTVCLLALASCAGLSDGEESKLNGYKLNSKNYYTQGKYLQAIDQCRKGLAIEEDDYSLNLELGMALLYQSNKVADRGERMRYLFSALEQFEKTNSLRWLFSADDYRVHLGLGMVHYKIATEYRKRCEDLERRLAGDPTLEGDLEDGIDECRDGVDVEVAAAKKHLHNVLEYERQSENLEALLRLGQVYAYSQEFEEATAYLKKGLDLLERSTDFIRRRLESEDTMAATEKAYYEARLQANLTREKELRGILANSYARLDRHMDRLTQFIVLEERGLMDGALSYNKALAEQELGLYPDAIIDFTRFIREGLGPENVMEDREKLPTAVTRMMEMAEEMERTDAAQRFVEANPDQERDLHSALANLYSSVGNFEKCIQEYDVLQARGLMNGDLYYSRARAEQEIGRLEEAIMDFDRFLKEGSIPGIHVEADERLRIATESIQKCRELLERNGRNRASGQ